MVYSLGYRRPSRVASSEGSYSDDEKRPSFDESVSSGSSGNSHGIPEALSFDRIISGGTCPPCTVREFMDFLKYIEFSAENLQFYLWFQDYAARFEQLPESEKTLAPEWTQAQADAEANASKPTSKRSKKVDSEFEEVLKNSDFADDRTKASESGDPFKTPSTESPREMSSDYTMSHDGTYASKATHQTVAGQAFDDAGMKWQPFTVQPYRTEIDRIISIYIAERSPRELNISSRQRAAVLHALQNTTHPSAFRPAVRAVEHTLRRQAHPNFIRWAICNGNRPRVVFARGLGIAGIVAGFVSDLLITLSSVSRAWRVLPFIGWFIGIATLIAAWKGMCVVLHGMHHRHLRPWELFMEPEEGELDEKRLSSETFMSQSTNSFEDEPWVARYDTRNVVRKVFDREVWITEPALRQIQDTIFLQAVLGGLVLSAIAVGIFCAVPKGNFF